MPKLKDHVFLVIIHIGALLPLIIMAWDFTQNQLTANPIREIQLRTGRYAMLMITLSLAGTPVYDFTGLKLARRLRRPLGLYAFAYAGLHLLNMAGLDYGFNLALLWEDIDEKRYILAGFLAFLILLALAVTSTGRWTARLGKNWRHLHRLVYAAAILAVLHYAWQTKVFINAPLIYGIIIIVLLALRLPPVRGRIKRRLKRPETEKG